MKKVISFFFFYKTITKFDEDPEEFYTKIVKMQHFGYGCHFFPNVFI